MRMTSSLNSPEQSSKPTKSVILGALKLVKAASTISTSINIALKLLPMTTSCSTVSKHVSAKRANSLLSSFND